ncbi:MAG: hypothetical protein LKF69_04490 [Bacilli bacterium]|nr:hypothetical protein [Bacilli bacterium]MCH4236037.1 hypothetical protein [Bacilli bacterium]
MNISNVVAKLKNINFNNESREIFVEKRAKELFNEELIHDELVNLGVTENIAIKNLFAIERFYFNRLDREELKTSGLSSDDFFELNIALNGDEITTEVNPSVNMRKAILRKNNYPFSQYPNSWLGIRNVDVSINSAQKEYFAALKKLSSNFTNEKNWIFVKGDFHTGKTFITVAYLNTVFNSENKTVSMINAAQMINNLANLLTGDPNEFNREFEQIKNVFLLAIDDFGCERVNLFTIDNITFPLLQYRVDRNLPTIILSDINLDEMNKIYLAATNNLSTKRKVNQMFAFIKSKIEKQIIIKKEL